MTREKTHQTHIPQSTKNGRTLGEKLRTIITYVGISILTILTHIDKGYAQSSTGYDLISELGNSKTKENFLDGLNRGFFQMTNLGSIENSQDLEKLQKGLSKGRRGNLENLTGYKSMNSKNLEAIIGKLFDKPGEAEHIWRIIGIGGEWDKKAEQKQLNIQQAFWDLTTLFNLSQNIRNASLENKEVYKLFFEICITLAESKNTSLPRNTIDKELVKKAADAFAKLVSLLFTGQDLIEVTILRKEKILLISKVNASFVGESVKTNFLTLWENYGSYALGIITNDIYEKQ